MEIILREDIDTLGTRGQMVKVADGYARNYLIPKGLAVLATQANKKMVADMRAAYLRQETKRAEEARELGKLIEKSTITITAKVGENDHLFGSVTAIDIHDALAKLNYNIDRRKIVLSEPIKTAGVHKVTLKLHKDVTQELVVNVEPEGGFKPKPVAEAPVVAPVVEEAAAE